MPPYLPPGLDEVQVGRICRLEDELPAGVRQGAQEDIGGPMGALMIHNRIEPLKIWANPRLHSCKEVDIVHRSPSRRGCG
jgi:hypothetical protein